MHHRDDVWWRQGRSGAPWHGWLVALAVGLAPMSTAAQSAAIAVRIEPEVPSVARPGWPISFGVPFPVGALPGGEGLELQGRVGAGSIPIQARALSHWPDGSVRWALVDAQVDLSAQAPRAFRIVPGASAPPAIALAVSESDAAVSVDTGVLHFTIPKDRFALLEEVRLRGEPIGVGPVSAFMSIEARHHAAGPPESVRILDRGPLRARIELRGVYGGEFSYVARIDAFAGASFVRVLLSFEQRGTRTYSNVRQIGVDIPFLVDEDGATWAYRAGREEKEPLSGDLGEATVVLWQEDHLSLRRDGSQEEGRSAGWVDVHDGTRGIALAGRFVWEEYPKSFHIDRGRVRYNLWAPEAPPASIGMGAAKTHEFVLSFSGRARPTAEDVGTMAEPVIARLEPDWIVASGALTNGLRSSAATQAFLAEMRAGFDRYREGIASGMWDETTSLNCDEVAGACPRQGFYGMLNWGDWNFPWYRDLVNGCETWGNLEYDLTQVLALGFAATGDRELHRVMTAAARHFMDVDRIHTEGSPCDCFGMTHPRVARHFSFELGQPDLGFAWTEGLVSYFFLTGDERALDAVRGIADFLVRRRPQDGESLRPRQYGWPMIALVSAYEATGDLRYKKAARHYARHAMRAYPPSSGRDVGVGTLADGLAYVHALLQNRSVRRWLLMHAASVMSAPPGVADPRYFPAVAYVARLTDNAEYRAAAADAARRQGFDAWGKPFTLAGRIGFRILSLLE